jgi:acetoacetyl-CoA synthetase
VWDVPSLYAWSVARPEAFWPEVWRFCGVVADERNRGEPWDQVVIGLDRMAPPDPRLGPRWFAGDGSTSRENLPRHDGDGHARLWNEQGFQRRLSFRLLRGEVAAAADALGALGVGEGDRVAGFLPNLPETVVAMLATASRGAIWSSCSPDFGVNGVLDRFGQIGPKVLVCADGYGYAGKTIDHPADPRGSAATRDIRHVVVVPYLSPRPDLTSTLTRTGGRAVDRHRGRDTPACARAVAPPTSSFLGHDRFPKCIVHGAEEHCSSISRS